jgi:hypothetical protein
MLLPNSWHQLLHGMLWCAGYMCQQAEHCVKHIQDRS